MSDLSVCVQDHKQWRNIAFCLGQLSIGEKGFRKMADLFRCYKDSLADPDILAFFQVTPHHSSITAVLPAHHPAVLVLGDWDKNMLDKILSRTCIDSQHSRSCARQSKRTQD